LYLFNSAIEGNSNFWTYVIAVGVNILTNILIISLSGLPKIRQLKRNKDQWVNDETEKRLRDELEN
jgi:hypothetical protein